MENQKNFPYHFNQDACKACRGKCCRGIAGYVWVSMEELEKMAGTKKMDLTLFSTQYIRQVQGRLSLQERAINGEHFCCFFDPINCQCTIYQNRPKQCRTYPFWNQLTKDPQKLVIECPGVIRK